MPGLWESQDSVERVVNLVEKACAQPAHLLLVEKAACRNSESAAE